MNGKGGGNIKPLEVVEVHRIYKHFKGKLYYVVGLAEHTETKEVMVIYHALYDDYLQYVRPIKMFVEELPEEKQSQYHQKHRFEPWDYGQNKPEKVIGDLFDSMGW